MKKYVCNSIVFLIAISPLFKGLYYDYHIYAFLAVIFFLTFFYCIFLIKNKEIIHINKTYVIMGAVLVSANIISFANAVNPRENLDSLMIYTSFLIVLIIFHDHFYNRKLQLLKKIMVLVIIVGFFCAIIGLEALTGAFEFLGSTLFLGRLGSTFEYTNTAAIYFSICLLFTLTISNTVENLKLRSSLVGAGSIFAYALLMTGSRGGYLIGVAAILLFLFIQPRGCRHTGWINLLCLLLPLFITLNGFTTSASKHNFILSSVWLGASFLIAVVLCILIYLMKGVIAKKNIIKISGSYKFVFVAIFSVIIISILIIGKEISFLPSALGSRLEKFSLNDLAVLYRLEFDKDAIKLISKNWLLGLGGGGWHATYQSVQDVYYESEFVHNNYLQIFVETGIVGFLSFGLLTIIVILNSFKSYLKEYNKELKVYYAGLFCSIIAIALHSSFDFDMSFISLALLFWVLMAVVSTQQATEKANVKNIDKQTLLKRPLLLGNNLFGIVLTVLCAVLFSAYLLFFTAAYNGNIGSKLIKAGNYESALLYFKEANRLDPQNSNYLFELSKLYNFIAESASNSKDRIFWLNKAKSAGEDAIHRNKNYPPSLKALILTYRNLNMPLKYLEYTQKLIAVQRCDALNYELLAESYLEAANYCYRMENDDRKAKELIYKCIEIKDNPYLKKSTNNAFYIMKKKESESNYIPSEQLNLFLSEAYYMLNEIEKNKSAN